MTELGAHLLGRTVEHDPKNWDHPFPIRKLAKPVDRDWKCPVPILNQRKIGSCEGNTAAEWTNCTVNANNRKAYDAHNAKRGAAVPAYLKEPDAVAMYSKATHLDNDQIPGVYPPTDTGTSAVGIAKAMQFYGAITNYQWTFGLDHFLAAIDKGPVMMGTNWYHQMFDPDTDGTVHIGGAIDGGHAWLARKIHFTGTGFIVTGRNHWEASWGLDGEFLIGDKDFERLLKEQGDVLVPGRM